MTGATGTAEAGDGAWTYLLITPDGVAGGTAATVLGLVAEHGLRPVYCRPIGLDVGTMQEFYGGSASFRIQDPGRADFEFSWKTHEALYALAPACLVLVTHDGDACRAMLRCKGKTRPELADPGTVRHLGENVIFNLVHCPDDTASARRELDLLLGPVEARRVRSLLPAADPRIGHLAGVAALRASLPAAGTPGAISFPAVANRIRRRVVQLLAPGLPSTGLSALTRARRLLDDEERALAAGRTSRERLLVAIAADEAIAPELTAAAALRGAAEITAGLAALSSLFRLRDVRRPEVVFAMAGGGIYVSPLERVIVESHAYAFRPNGELAGLY